MLNNLTKIFKLNVKMWFLNSCLSHNSILNHIKVTMLLYIEDCRRFYFLMMVTQNMYSILYILTMWLKFFPSRGRGPLYLGRIQWNSALTNRVWQDDFTCLSSLGFIMLELPFGTLSEVLTILATQSPCCEEA